MEDMILKEKALSIVDSWIEYYEDVKEQTNEGSSANTRVKSVLYVLNRISEEIEEA